MILKFELTMPIRNSWDGKWSKENELNAICIDFSTKDEIILAKNLIEIKDFKYDFEDGWIANVNISEITQEQAENIKELSKGFAGYDWMIESIIKNKEIKIS